MSLLRTHPSLPSSKSPFGASLCGTRSPRLLGRGTRARPGKKAKESSSLLLSSSSSLVQQQQAQPKSQKWFKVHPSHEKYMNKMIDMYDEMALVVEIDMATGSFAKQLGDIDVMEVDSSPIDLDDEFDKLMKGSKTSLFNVHPEKRSHKRQRCSDNDDKYATLSTQLGEIASTIMSLVQSSVDYSKLYNEVMKANGYGKLMVFDHLVENEKIGKSFVMKSANLQKVRFNKFLSKGEQDE